MSRSIHITKKNFKGLTKKELDEQAIHIMEQIQTTKQQLMNNKVSLLICLILATNLFSCKKEEKYNYAKWESLNIQIISSYVESMCIEKKGEIPTIHNYIELSGHGISTEERFNNYVKDFQEKKYGSIKYFSKTIDSLFTEENIAFFKPQYLVKKDYVNSINETGCIKNIKKQFPNEEVELVTLVKSYSFGKILFTKDYEYGIVNFSDPYGVGYIIFKKNMNGIYERRIKSYVFETHRI